MGLYELSFLILLLHLHLLFIDVYCKSEIEIGYRVSIAVPIEYFEGFIGRAFIMELEKKNEIDQILEPNFKTALSVEAINGKYSCSLQVFLGGVKVWNSGHYSPFFISDECVLELTNNGDLQLLGPKSQLGWRSATSAQGVQRLQILSSGNLVLVDAFNGIKWQSFNFPTDVILSGQRLSVGTTLTSFPTHSTPFFYSLEIQQNKIALHLNSATGKWNYSYWQFKPPNNMNITFLQLTSKGLEFFNQNNHKIAQTNNNNNKKIAKLRFLALSNKTGNLGLYFYSPEKGNFEAAFEALNTSSTICDLPLACKPYGICTLSNTCSCINQFLKTKEKKKRPADCSGEGFSGELCGRGEVEMVELGGVSSVLMPAAPTKVNINKEGCASLCIQECKCVAALYSSSSRECFLYYGLVLGAKQVEKGSGIMSYYMVKIPKGMRHGGNGKTGVKKWILIMVGVIDGFVIIVIILGGFWYYYYFIPKTNNVTALDSTS